MSIGDIVVVAIAFAVLAFLCVLALINWKNNLKGLGWVIAVEGAGLVVLGIVIYVGVTARERKQVQECLTAHERRAKAYAAPDDYFGRQLREAA